MHARGHLGTEEVGLGPEELFRPLFPAHDSDSGKLDTTVELLLRGGRDVRHVVSMLVPEAWEGSRDLEPEVRDYFRYHACLTEPWDGPAGRDLHRRRARRRRPRPQRAASAALAALPTTAPSSCCSEAGAVPVTGRGRVQRGRLGPGEMLCVDRRGRRRATRAGRTTRAVKRWLASRAPYGDWARDGLLSFLPGHAIDMPPSADELVPEQAAFGLNREEVAMVLKPMATDAKEPTFSMGDDTPFAAVVRTRPRPVFHFLKQRFAQVSQPADRPPPRAPRHVAAHVSRSAPAAAHRGRGPRRGCSSCRPSSSTPTRSTRCSTRRTTRSAAVLLDASFPVADGAGRPARRPRGARAASASRPCTAARGSSSSPTRTSVPTARRSRRCSRPARCTTG